MIGQQLGQYRITRRLSAGGMGEVYVAEHVLIGKKAAIKLLLPQISQNEEIVKRFFNEARATSAIGHPGIVQIFDFGLHSDGRAYCVMEFLEGEPLQDRIKKNGKLALGHAIDMLQHVCSALGAAHRKGIVHRDLKPDNIFLVPDPGMRFGERAKLLDFGIAKLQDQQSEEMKTRTGLVMGTPAYMAPEQCRGAGEVDHRADVYALGCIFFAMLCGRPPFVGAGAGEIIGMQQFMEPPRPSSIDPSIDPHTEALILHLLQKRPEARVQSTDELARALEALEAHVTGGMRQLRPPTGQPIAATTPMAPLRPSSPEMPQAPFGETTPIQAPGQPNIPNARVVAAPPARPAVALTTPPETLAGKPSPTTLHSAAMERPGAAATGASTSRRWIAIAAGMGVTAAVGVAVLSVTGSDEKSRQSVATAPVADASVDATVTIAAVVDAAARAPEAVAATPPDGGTGETTTTPEAPEAPEAGSNVAAETTKTETPHAAAETVALVIESTPPGAAVYLAGSRKQLGQTPYTHKAPKGEDKLSFKVDLAGYASRSVTFSTAAGDTKHLRLERDSTSLLDSKSTTKKPDKKGTTQTKPPDTKDPFGK